MLTFMVKSILRATASPSKGMVSCEGEEPSWKLPSWDETIGNIGKLVGDWLLLTNEVLNRGDWNSMIEDWLVMISSGSIKLCMTEGEYPKGKALVEKPCWQVSEAHLVGSGWSKLLEISWFTYLKASMEAASPNILVLGKLFGLQSWIREQPISSWWTKSILSFSLALPLPNGLDFFYNPKI